MAGGKREGQDILPLSRNAIHGSKADTFRCRLITLTSSPMTAKKKSGLSTKNAILAGRDIEENI